MAPPPFLSHIWLQSFRTFPPCILSSVPHLHHHFQPSVPSLLLFFLPSTLIWPYYSIHDSLNLPLPYRSQLTKHLFFAVFSSNLPSFISIFYSWLHFFQGFFFPPLAITANLSILISIVLLFAAERSSPHRGNWQTNRGAVGPGGSHWHFIVHMEELLFVKIVRRERQHKWWYSRITHAWMATAADIRNSCCLG